MARTRQAPVVAVLNMKGGVGKTTLAANVFHELFELKKIPLLLIDFDAQFNLSQLLLTRSDYDAFEREGRTIHSVLQHPPADSVFAVSREHHEHLPPTDSVVTPVDEVPGPPPVKLHLVPGDFRLAIMNVREMSALRVPRRRLEAFVERARSEYRCVVLDCNPSSSFVTRCAVELATHVLVPVRPDKFSLLGVEMVHRYIKLLRAHSMPEVHVVLNDLPSGSSGSDAISQLRADTTYGPLVLANVVRHSEHLKAKPDYAGFATDRRSSYWRDIKGFLQDVAVEYAPHLGL